MKTMINEKKKKKVWAIFGKPNLSITKKRLEAFKNKIDDTIKTTYFHANSTLEAEEFTADAIKQHADTVFCMSDEILVGAMKAIQKAKLKIPDDIAVIAISNGFIPKLYYPEITYVETSGYKLGKLAFISMMACIAGSTFTQELTIESMLVEGESI